MNQFNDIKFTYEAMEKILRQLEAREESVNQQRILVQQILSKFSIEVIIKLEESKNLQESWSVKLLRESLQCYIRVHENARKHETNINSFSYKNVKRNDHYGHRPFSDKITHSPVEALMTKGGNEQHKQGEPAFPCVFL